jgi:hypothetical protein
VPRARYPTFRFRASSRSGSTHGDGVQSPDRYEFVDDVYVTNGLRGWYEYKVYLAFPDSASADTDWYPADPLPLDTNAFRIVRSHRERIVPVPLTACKKRTQPVANQG